MSPFIGEGDCDFQERGDFPGITQLTTEEWAFPRGPRPRASSRSVAGPTGQLRPINPTEAAVLWGGMERWFQAL